MKEKAGGLRAMQVWKVTTLSAKADSFSVTLQKTQPKPKAPSGPDG